jgi:hypothetical protein
LHPAIEPARTLHYCSLFIRNCLSAFRDILLCSSFSILQTGMAADNGAHINFVGLAAADNSAASPIPPVPEKHVGHDIDSIYDEEEVIATKESDFKHKQVCMFGNAGVYL